MMDIITGESPRGAQRAGNPNDPEDAAVAYRNLGNISVSSWGAAVELSPVEPVEERMHVFKLGADEGAAHLCRQAGQRRS